MTILQVKYFITAATCLNFTQAADLLYITQPTLSRQISAMENELNLQLFIRNNRSVRLTPAAKILLEELKDLDSQYEHAVERAQNAQRGISGQLRIGILDGTRVDDFLPRITSLFAQKYPYIDLSLEYHSFNALARLLYERELDVALTLLFDIMGRVNLRFQILEKGRDHIAVLKTHPLADREFVRLTDFKNETFLIVGFNDSAVSAKLILEACRAQGFEPKVKFSPSIQTSMLWLQSGLGISMLDSRNILRFHPNIRFLDVDQVSDPSLTAAWHPENDNPALPLFLDLLPHRGNGISE